MPARATVLDEFTLLDFARQFSLRNGRQTEMFEGLGEGFRIIVVQFHPCHDGVECRQLVCNIEVASAEELAELVDGEGCQEGCTLSQGVEVLTRHFTADVLKVVNACCLCELPH